MPLLGSYQSTEESSVYPDAPLSWEKQFKQSINRSIYPTIDQSINRKVGTILISLLFTRLLFIPSVYVL